ncbi:MAG: GTP-binding protein [Anaerolineae bacterium]
MEVRTPISLITGSLGSGKTTLLKNILNTTDRRLAVLMNEFGEIAIDSQVIQGEHVQIVELAGGCACCALAGEFEAAVAEIVEKVAPELIVVEATGVAEADSLAYMVEDNLPQVRLDSVMCIVDAYMSIKYPHVGYAARTQLQAADIVLINKIDLVTPEEVQEVEAQVRKYNDTAVLFRTVRCDVDLDLLFGLDIEKRTIPIVHHRDVDFDSFTFTTDRPLARAKFQQVITDLPPSVYRAKGFVRFAEGGYLFNYVVRRPELEEFPAEETQLVFIGPHLDETREAILSQLRDCEV